jgi:hypothetical protein
MASGANLAHAVSVFKAELLRFSSSLQSVDHLKRAVEQRPHAGGERAAALTGP